MHFPPARRHLCDSWLCITAVYRTLLTWLSLSLVRKTPTCSTTLVKLDTRPRCTGITHIHKQNQHYDTVHTAKKQTVPAQMEGMSSTPLQAKSHLTQTRWGISPQQAGVRKRETILESLCSIGILSVSLHRAADTLFILEQARHQRGVLTCPRSSVTFTSLYPGPLERGGLCHHRSVPSIAFVTGWALLGLLELQWSQNWP